MVTERHKERVRCASVTRAVVEKRDAYVARAVAEPLGVKRSCHVHGSGAAGVLRLCNACEYETEIGYAHGKQMYADLQACRLVVISLETDAARGFAHLRRPAWTVEAKDQPYNMQVIHKYGSPMSFTMMKRAVQAVQGATPTLPGKKVVCKETSSMI
eukprot:1659208-Pyramimonas_sp.AAC.1